MRLRSLVPAQRGAARTLLGLESGDILITNQDMLCVTIFCTKEGSNALTNSIFSRHHATTKALRCLDFPTSFLPPKVYDAQII